MQLNKADRKKTVFVWKFFRHVIDDCSNCSFHFTNQPIVTFETQLKLSILHWSTSRTIIDQWSVVMHSQPTRPTVVVSQWVFNSERYSTFFWHWWWAYRWCRVKQRFRESSASSTIGIGLRYLDVVQELHRITSINLGLSFPGSTVVLSDSRWGRPSEH